MISTGGATASPPAGGRAAPGRAVSDRRSGGAGTAVPGAGTSVVLMAFAASSGSMAPASAHAARIAELFFQAVARAGSPVADGGSGPSARSAPPAGSARSAPPAGSGSAGPAGACAAGLSAAGLSAAGLSAPGLSAAGRAAGVAVPHHDAEES
jgi:flagellar hook-length control protein FliK